MKPIRLLVVVGSLTILPACFESPDPLGRPGEGGLDLRLSGDWQCESRAHGDTPTKADLWVIPFDDKQYYAEWRDGNQVGRYRAYSSRVGGATLLNLEEMSFRVGSAGWVFVRYRLETDGRLRLSLVSDKALDGLKGKAALRAIAKRVNDESLYEPFATCAPGKS